MVITRSRRSLRRRTISLVGGLTLFVLAIAAGLADEPAPNHQAAPSVEHEQGLSEPSKAPATEARKQALSFGFVMLGSIIFGGTLLLALVVIWGNRTRRMARSPLPPVSKPDELWFLKPKKDADEDAEDDVKGGPDQRSDPSPN